MFLVQPPDSRQRPAELSRSPGPRLPSQSLAAVAVGLAAAGALIGLAVAGKAELSSAFTAAALVAALAVGLALFPVSSTGPPTAAVASGEGTPPERVEETPYLAALELAPDPLLLVSAGEVDDLAGRRIDFANGSAREMLRIPRQGALLLVAMRNPNVLEAIDEALFGRIDRVVAFETSGAQSQHWRVWIKPLPDTPSKGRAALVTLRDETQIRLNERLRADFLANASHELRTPLASLAGFIETLRGHARDDVAARERFLAIMTAQAERMARLIDDLLSLSRIELNEHIRPSGACDLSLAVGDVVDWLAPQMQAKSVQLRLNRPPAGEALLIGDRDQIVQVVQNLVDNAIKYSPAGGVVQVEVRAGITLAAAGAPPSDSARLASPDGGRMSLLTPTWAGADRFAVLRVEDSGTGIAREHLPRLTERFYRVEGQRSSARTGTGLGLAIVKHVVNRHRGGLWVESAPDAGAAFCVYFPMSTAPPSAATGEPVGEQHGPELVMQSLPPGAKLS